MSFSSDSFYLKKFFFDLLFIYLALWVLIGAHGSSISVVACRIFTCGMWDLVPWPGIEFGPPVLGAWSLSHCSQANRQVPRNWFKLKVQSLEFSRLWNSPLWQQEVLEKTEFVIILLMVLFGYTPDICKGFKSTWETILSATQAKAIHSWDTWSFPQGLPRIGVLLSKGHSSCPGKQYRLLSPFRREHLWRRVWSLSTGPGGGTLKLSSMKCFCMH